MHCCYIVIVKNEAKVSIWILVCLARDFLTLVFSRKRLVLSASKVGLKI